MPTNPKLELACLRPSQHILHMLPDEQPSPEQINIWQAMSSERRVVNALLKHYWEAQFSE
jgi:hypothetical protein